jgi:hypothetical protein
LVLYSKGYIDQRAREVKTARAKMATVAAMTPETPNTGITAIPPTGIQESGQS